VTVLGIARRIAYPMQDGRRVARAVVSGLVACAIFGPAVLALDAAQSIAEWLEARRG
jgi:hypothetical protein